MKAKGLQRVTGLFVFISILLLLPARGYSHRKNFSKIISPKQWQHVKSTPVEIIVDFWERARPETFRAWLNGRNITDLFEVYENSATAFVSHEDGLRVKWRGRNILKTKVRGRKWKRDMDHRVFFVRDNVTVPNVEFLDKKEAIKAIKEAHLRVCRIRGVQKLMVPTGVVVKQEPEPGSEVPASTCVHLEVVKPPPMGEGEEIPEDWTGEWEFTITFNHITTGQPEEEDIVTDHICPGDPVGLGLLELVLEEHPKVTHTECTGMASEESIEGSCLVRVIDDVCDLDVTLEFEIDRNGDTGDTLSGTGQWTTTGVCASVPVHEGETIAMSGVRLSTDDNDRCEEPPSSFFQRFMRHDLLFTEEGIL